MAFQTPITHNLFHRQSTTDTDPCEINEQKIEDNSINELNFSTEESHDELSLQELEDMIENLLNDKTSLQDLPKLFKPFSGAISMLPTKPEEPAPGECCGSGCMPCVWDTYERDLEVHQRAVTELSEQIMERSDLK